MGRVVSPSPAGDSSSRSQRCRRPRSQAASVAAAQVDAVESCARGSRSGRPRRGAHRAGRRAIRSPATPATKAVVRAVAQGQRAHGSRVVATRSSTAVLPGPGVAGFFCAGRVTWVPAGCDGCSSSKLFQQAEGPLLQQLQGRRSPQQRKPDGWGRPWAVRGRSKVSIRAASLCRSLALSKGLASRIRPRDREPRTHESVADAGSDGPFRQGRASQAEQAVRPGARAGAGCRRCAAGADLGFALSVAGVAVGGRRREIELAFG